MKNTILKIQLIISLILTIGFTSCGEDVVRKSINLSETSFTLPLSGEESRVIQVNSTEAWTASTTSDWIKSVYTTNTVTITADRHAGINSRVGEVVITSGSNTASISVSQSGSNREYNVGSTGDYFPEGVISRNGNYIAGATLGFSGGYEVRRIDTRTGEARLISIIPGDDVITFVSAVDDFGNIFMSDGFGHSGKILTKDGKFQEIPLPDGYIGASIQAISSDGTVWVGDVANAAGGVSAIKWVDGVPTVLKDPDLLVHEGQTDFLYLGCGSLGCSDDGSIVYGVVYDQRVSIYWDKDNTPHYVADELTETEWYDPEDHTAGFQISGAKIFYELYMMSSNGRYIGFGLDQTMAKPGGIFNTETKEIIKTPEGSVQTVLNDGTIIMNEGTSYYPSLVRYPDGRTISGDEFIKNETGIIPIKGSGIWKVINDENGDLKALFGGLDDGNRGFTIWYITKN